MDMEQLLLACPVEHWQTRQTVVFDWHDGPRHGICELATPQCEFLFDLVAERFNPNGLDDRLFRLREIPKGTIASILSLISTLGTPAFPVWVPVWSFANVSERAAADAAIDELLNSSRHADIVIRTHDMIAFLGCWQVIAVPPEGTDWFAQLGI
ncbi:MAG: hypothetical protein V4719_11970 [Planctomycetota bacterium]